MIICPACENNYRHFKCLLEARAGVKGGWRSDTLVCELPLNLFSSTLTFGLCDQVIPALTSFHKMYEYFM